MIKFTFKFKGKDISLSWSNEELLSNNLLSQLSNLGVGADSAKEHHLRLESNIPNIENEYNNVLSKLESIEFPENPVIVDIGCGSGFIDLVLAKYFEGKATFYLIDGDDNLDQIEKNQNKLIHSPNFKTANSWKCLQDGLATNNINSKFQLMSPNDDWTGIQADVVMSISSCGMHYPVDPYWERIKSTIKPNGYFCLFPLLSLTPPNFMKGYYGPALVHNRVTFAQIKEKRANDYVKWLDIWPHKPSDNEEWAAYKIWKNTRLTS